MIELDEILPELLVHAPNVPEPLAIRYLRVAAQELCRRTNIWRVTDSFRITSPECEGLLSVQDATIEKVEYASLNERELTPITVAALDLEEPGWMHRYANGETASAHYVVQTRPDTISVWPKEAGDMLARMVLVPSRTALVIPDFVVDHHSEALAKGAAARILMMPAQEFYNPQLASAYQMEWQAYLDQRAFEDQKTQLRTKPRSRPHHF